MIELEKNSKKQLKNKIKQKRNVKKPLARKKSLTINLNSILIKTRPRLNYEWIGKAIRKKNRTKNRKNKSEMAACEQKTTSDEKANF